MLYEVTTQADIEMNNGTQIIEADSPEAAAGKYGPLRAADYFDDPADHVGELEVILVQEPHQEKIHEVTVRYE